MSEYIIKAADWAIDYKGESLFKGCEEIVRCRDCVHYYEAEEYHPQGNYDRRCCKYFDTYNNEVEPDGFCAWGERANFATCECGEDIELGNRESAVCPRCNRTVIA